MASQQIIPPIKAWYALLPSLIDRTISDPRPAPQELVNTLQEFGQLETTQITALQQKKKRRSLKTRQEVPDIPEECLNLPEPDLQQCIDDLAPASSTTLQTRQASALFSSAEQQEVCKEFNAYVAASQKMLTSVTAKASLHIDYTPFAAPIASVLKFIENSSDALAFGIIDRVPDCATAVKAGAENLTVSLKKTILAYEADRCALPDCA